MALDKTNPKSVFEPFFLNTNIDWDLLLSAHQFYKNNNYSYIEVPWTTPIEYHKSTKPHDNSSFIHKAIIDNHEQAHELVASAEQGFIYLLNNELINVGKYFSISPCFRFDNYDTTHFPWFMKLELFILPIENSQLHLQSVIHDAQSFFNSKSKTPITIKPFEDGTFDLELNGLEIGSYGIRKHNNIEYIYGTGIALPRFSQAQNKN